MDRYLDALTQICRQVLGPGLAGVYLHGSTAVGETARSSDIDILVVVAQSITDGQKRALAAQLDHRRLPVPASGLELMAMTIGTASNPPPIPQVPFAMSTGETWTTEIESDVDYEDLLLDTAMARETARALFGPPPREVFGPVDRTRLLRLIVQALEWHRPRLLDAHHDPLGQNSVLNAARAWAYAESGSLMSKAQGGRWAMTQGRDTALIERALAIRHGKHAAPPEPHEIDRFLVDVVGICRAALGD